MILKFTILALMLLAPKTWEHGKLISVNRERNIGNTGGGFPRAFRPVSYILSLEVQIKGNTYVIDGHFEPTKDRAPKVIENDLIQYRMDHEKLFLLDTDGKELKLKIIKIRKP